MASGLVYEVDVMIDGNWRSAGTWTDLESACNGLRVGGDMQVEMGWPAERMRWRLAKQRDIAWYYDRVIESGEMDQREMRRLARDWTRHYTEV